MCAAQAKAMDPVTYKVDAETRSAVRAFLALLEGKYDVAQAVLYGSRARGNHHEDSDADLLLVLRGEPQPVIRTKLAMIDEAYQVELDTGIFVSPFPVHETEWKSPRSTVYNKLFNNIRREGVPM
jgi:uncharacterized protein